MTLKKIFNTLRYDNRLLAMAVLILAGAAGLAIESWLYNQRMLEIEQLKSRIQNSQKPQILNKKVKIAPKNIPLSKAILFEGLYQEAGVLYAVVNGHLLRPQDKIGGFQLLEIARTSHKVHFKNLTTGEIISINLR